MKLERRRMERMSRIIRKFQTQSPFGLSVSFGVELEQRSCHHVYITMRMK